ncbi:hypothetical protein PybrP1_012203 [[Pythium] brassicae (nom. inval.)]|nr:hypothetical protein PybrP1_012203 [[Pythium] brassicae (nom. inval.)]
MHLQWEWCFSHLARAATKAACGLNTNSAGVLPTPAAAHFIKRVQTAINTIRSAEKMGTLFEALVQQRSGSASQLIAFKSHRFLGLAQTLKQVLLHWSALQEWFNARSRKAKLDEEPASESFPLTNTKNDVEELFSLLCPIVDLNRRSQAESELDQGSASPVCSA